MPADKRDAAVPEPSDLDIAIPFLVAAGLLVAGQLIAELVRSRLETVYERWIQRSGVKEGKLPYAFSPAPLALMANWIIDASQALSVPIAPLVGFLLLRGPGLGTESALVYGATFLAGLTALVWFLVTKHPELYASKRWLRYFTPLTVLGVLINLVAAGAAAVLAP